MRICEDDDCEAPVPDDARADAEFCSSACRQRTYRRRKRLFASYGGTAEGVADALLGRYVSSRNAGNDGDVKGCVTDDA